MQESSFSELAAPPIASPEETLPRHQGPTGHYRPGEFAIAFGHFLWFGFLGQIAFTLLITFIPSDHFTSSHNSAVSGSEWMLLALCVPGLCAVAGVCAAAWKPLSDLGHPFRMVLTFLGIGALVMCDFVMMGFWAMAGYC